MDYSGDSLSYDTCDNNTDTNTSYDNCNNNSSNNNSSSSSDNDYNIMGCDCDEGNGINMCSMCLKFIDLCIYNTANNQHK